MIVLQQIYHLVLKSFISRFTRCFKSFVSIQKIYRKIYKKEWMNEWFAQVDSYLVSSKLLLFIVFIFKYLLSLNGWILHSSSLSVWCIVVIEALNVCIECTFVLHAKSMFIGWRVRHFNKKSLLSSE